MEYKIHDFKYDWNGNFSHARTCIQQALDQINFKRTMGPFNIFNHTDITKVPYKSALFVKPTTPTSKHFAIDTIGYANFSSLAFEEPMEYEPMYSYLNPHNNMEWSIIEGFIENKSNKWDDSIILKWRQAKKIPKDHILVIGQMPHDETVEGFGFGGHVKKLDLIVERLVKEVSGYPIVLKLHPKFKGEKKLIQKWKDWGVDVRQAFNSIHDFLPRTRVAIVDNSTAGIECLMHEVPLISHGWPEYHWVTKILQVLPQLPSLVNDLSWHEKERAKNFIYWYINDYLCHDVKSTVNRLNGIFNS